MTPRATMLPCAALALVVLASCSDAPTPPPPTLSPSASAPDPLHTATVATFAAASVAAPVPPVASSTPSAPFAMPLPAWLDAPPVDAPAMRASRTFVGAQLRLPTTWRTLDFGDPGNNPSNGLHSYFPFPKPDEPGDGTGKAAVIVVVEHVGVDDVVLVYGADSRFTWVIDETWQPATRHTIGASPVDVLRGRGRLHLHDADLWQIRRKRPTAGAGTTLLVLAALRRDAPAEARAGFYASLASLTID